MAAIVRSILGDEGYDVSWLEEVTEESLCRAIGELEPDCILLDGSSTTHYDSSWAAAAWIRHRTRSVPVVMFSAHFEDSREARANLTDRSRDAGFAAVILKPFSIDELLQAVSTAVRRSLPFDHSVPDMISVSECADARPVGG